MQNPYKWNDPKNAQMMSNDLKRLHMTSKDNNKNDKLVFKKVKTKKSLRGGDPSDS